MTKIKKILSYIVLFAICSIFVYGIYCVCYTYFLNANLEIFMAEQTKPIQDKIYNESGVEITSQYFIHRSQVIWFNIGKAEVSAYYSSYWVFRDGHPEQLPLDNYLKEERKNYGQTYEWAYSIRPMSDSKVCVTLIGYPPSSWKTEYAKNTWIIDISKKNWQLATFNLPCEKSKDILHAFLLFFH